MLSKGYAQCSILIYGLQSIHSAVATESSVIVEPVLCLLCYG